MFRFFMIAITVAMSICSVSQADIVLDQQFSFTSSIANSTNGNVSQMGQTFTVGVAGTLHHVDVYMFQLGGIFSPTGDPVFRIFNTSAGLPTGSALVTTSVPMSNVPLNNAAFVTFNVSAFNLNVNPGDILAFSLTASSGTGPYFLPTSQGQPINYSGGDAVAKFGNNPWQFFNQAQDHSFRTYVDAVPEPSSMIMTALMIGLGSSLRRRKGCLTLLQYPRGV